MLRVEYARNARTKSRATGFGGYYVNRYHPNQSTAVGGTGVAEMLFCTALVALVGAGEQPAFSPRSLHIANTKVPATG